MLFVFVAASNDVNTLTMAASETADLQFWGAAKRRWVGETRLQSDPWHTSVQIFRNFKGVTAAQV